MSGTSVRVEGLDPLSARVNAWPAQVAAALAREIHTEVRPMVAHMSARASAIGGAASISARSLGIVTGGDSITVHAGGGGLAGELLSGAEFGGRKRAKRSYATRSRSGNAYIVRRRTTQQFKPHLGNRGYWFWPVVRSDLKGVRARVDAVVARVVNG